ncbi:WD40/YVTN/BNR-like repeat-containing protein [Sorangium sp. So ce426]|uniref:WD40/YVTN/BNR-like repeat-containing protein n=1 Tax=Sorangium sp. So ce426 TaxID=3133312 RepID=UPI003F5BDFFC
MAARRQDLSRRAFTPMRTCFHSMALAALGAVALAGCPGDPARPPEQEPPAWRVLLDEDDLDRAVLSIWGTAPDDVFAVGGPLGNTGLKALALHYDGARWRELPAGGETTFWWVAGSGPRDVWMVGERGRAARWDGATFTEHATGTEATLWGVIAFSPDDAWAVGGMPGSGADAEKDIVLRWDGSAWSREPLPAATGRALYKVWGESSEDLYAVGEFGVIWHRSGSTWEVQSDPPIAQGTLFTAAGCSREEVYAVGGRDVLRSDGASWRRLEIELTNDVNGVACGRPGEVAIVGYGGLKQRLVDGAWIDEFTEEPYADLHAVWADKEGAFWAVGGDFLSQPTPGRARKGVVARYGTGQIADTVSR